MGNATPGRKISSSPDSSKQSHSKAAGAGRISIKQSGKTPRATLNTTETKKLKQSLQHYRTELSRQLRYRTIIRKITRAVHRSLNVSDVVEYAVRMMSANIEGADIVAIHFVEGNEAVIKGHSGYEEKYLKKLKRIPFPRGFTWKTIIEGKARY